MMLALRAMPRPLLALFFALVLAGCTAPTRWTMINVSPAIAQADCHLIEFPNGARVLIDAGEGVDAPPGTALNALRRRGVDHIDLALISHFHKDHYGRLVELIRAGIKIDRVAGNVPDPSLIGTEGVWGYDAADVRSFLAFLKGRGIPFFTPKPGQRLIDDSRAGASLDVVSLYDGLHTPIGKTDVNDTSIIVRLTDGKTRALFTGDLNYRMGAYLAKSDLDLSADLLKVPHHGTENAAPNEFFDRVHAKAALVPSPKALWWSLRSKRIRTYFADRGIPSYVSGIDGEVTVFMTGEGFTIETERPSPAPR
jgi:beta-lactamase superfamily II metal-dependent hydrolase